MTSQMSLRIAKLTCNLHPYLGMLTTTMTTVKGYMLSINKNKTKCMLLAINNVHLDFVNH